MRIRLILLALLAVTTALGATFKLYLQGGGDLMVTEYEIEGDRVRYYSSERRQWEEIPKEMVDLERTEKERSRREQRLEAMRRETEEELAAERKARTELHNVPIEDGVYFYLNDKATPVEQAEVQIDKSSKRGFLKVISPVPIIPGKHTLFIEGETANFTTDQEKPVFYVRQGSLARFGIVRLEVEGGKDRRVVQIINIVPQSEEMFEEQDEVQIFRRQLADGVYRIWPVEPLEPGQYAVIDYTPGEADLRVWDFAYQPAGEAPAKKPE